MEKDLIRDSKESITFWTVDYKNEYSLFETIIYKDKILSFDFGVFWARVFYV